MGFDEPLRHMPYLYGCDYNTIDGHQFSNTSAPSTGAVETTGNSQVKICV